MSQHYIAIVGIGSIGSRHIGNLLAMGYYNLVGVDNRTIQHEDRLSIVSTFEDLEPWDISHALICSPPAFHYYHAKHFVDRGIPTFIEKPMTETAIQARNLCAIAHMNKSILAVGYMERAHNAVINAKRWAVGRNLASVNIECLWKREGKSYDGSVSAESSHAIDTAFFICGADMKMESSVVHNEWARIVFRHRDGFSCIVYMHQNATPFRWIIMQELGVHGSTYIDGYGTTKEEWDTCYKAELQSFLDGKPICTSEDGLRVVEILEELQ